MKLRIQASRTPDGQEIYRVEAKTGFLSPWRSVNYNSYRGEVQLDWAWKYVTLEDAQFEVERIRKYNANEAEILQRKKEFTKNTVHWTIEV